MITKEELAQLKAEVLALNTKLAQFSEAAPAPAAPAPVAAPEPVPAPAAPAPTAPSVSAAAGQQMAQMHTTINSLNRQIKDMHEREIARDEEIENKAIADFVESQIRERRVLPKDRHNKVQLLQSVSGVELTTFSEDGSQLRHSPRQMLMNSISSGPTLYEEGEFPGGADPSTKATHNFGDAAVDRDSNALHLNVLEYASTSGLDPNQPDQYTEALDRYMKVHQVSF